MTTPERDGAEVEAVRIVRTAWENGSVDTHVLDRIEGLT